MNMDERRILIDRGWNERLENNKYKNWLKVSYGMHILCKGIRPYIERESKAFHTYLMGLAMPPCTCFVRGRWPTHDINDINYCYWAWELTQHHIHKKPEKLTWNQSDILKWTDPHVGHWEVAKLYMPFGYRGKSNAEETDGTGLLNLLQFCDHFKIDRAKVGALKTTRNDLWAHAPHQELTNDQTRAAFTSMRNILNDAEFQADPDAIEALEKITDIECSPLLEFLDNNNITINQVEQVAKDALKDVLANQVEIMNTLKDQEIQNNEINEKIDQVYYCLKVDAESKEERDQILLNILALLNRMEKRQTRSHATSIVMMNLQRFLKLLFSSFLLMVMFYVRLTKGLPRFAVVLIFLMTGFITLEKRCQDDVGCTEPIAYDLFGLKEFDFTEELSRARKGFVGRQWLFQNINDQLLNNEMKKGVLTTAPPGYGKSALASTLICSRLSSQSIHSKIIGYHMCIHSDRKTQDAGKFVRNLANMIATVSQEFKDSLSNDKYHKRILLENCLSDAVRCFKEGILQPLKKLNLISETNTWYIIIDALDECAQDASIVDLLKFTLEDFPVGFKIIATSRNVPDIQKKLSDLWNIQLRMDDPRNLHDIEKFVLSRFKIPHSFRNYLGEIIKKSQGNFLYIKLVMKYLEEKNFEVDLNSLPTSIFNVYQDFFERQFPSNEAFRAARKIFEVMATATVPLSVKELYDCLWTDNQDFDFEYDYMPILKNLAMYLSIEYPPRKNEVVIVFHNSLIEWLTAYDNIGERFYIDVKKGHSLLAGYYITKVLNSSVVANVEIIYDMAEHIVKGENETHKKRFLSFQPEIINITDSRTKLTALHLAARSNTKVLELLIRFFDEVDLEDFNCRTPASFAVEHGHLDNLCLLHQKNASLNNIACKINDFYVYYIGNSLSLLNLAIHKGNDDIVRYLLKNEVNRTIGIHERWNACHLAALAGHLEILQTLVEFGEPIDNYTLYFAAQEGHHNVVEFLLKNGWKDVCLDVSITFGLKKCKTAMHFAVYKKDQQLLEILLEHNASNTSSLNGYRRTPFQEAVHVGNYNATKTLLKAGADPSGKCPEIRRADGIVPGFYQKTFPDFVPCPCGYSPLHIAAYFNHAEITTLLLQHKANYSALDCYGVTPMDVAFCHRDIWLVLRGYVKSDNGFQGNRNALNYAGRCIIETILELMHKHAKHARRHQLHEMDLRLICKIFLTQASSDVLNMSVQIIEQKVVYSPEDTIYYEIYPDSAYSNIYNYSYGPISTELFSLNLVSYHWPERQRIVDYEEIYTNPPRRKSWAVNRYENDVMLSSVIGDIFNNTGLYTHQSQFLLNTIYRSKTRSFSEIVHFISQDCFSLVKLVNFNFVHTIDNYLRLSNNVNCIDANGVSPILKYLREGGGNVVSVLVKHGLKIDIKCGEKFEDSVFHLAAYHKVQYLQYIKVFKDSREWEKYLQTENALFDYLFDEYENVTKEGKSRIERVRDGPVTKAIKSHPKGFRIIDECLDDEGYTALHRAGQGGNVVAVKHFLDWGADVRVKSKDGWNPLSLAVKNAIKFSFKLKDYYDDDPSNILDSVSVLTSLETDFASLTVNIILDYLTKDEPFDVGCDNQKETLTLLHLAATRGIWRFIQMLFVKRNQSKVVGLDADCRTKHGITPMYLAKVYGGGDCQRDNPKNPWCKVIDVLATNGAKLDIVPDNIVIEYYLLSMSLFNGIPGPALSHHYTLQMQEERKGLKECDIFQNPDNLDNFTSQDRFMSLCKNQTQIAVRKILQLLSAPGWPVSGWHNLPNTYSDINVPELKIAHKEFLKQTQNLIDNKHTQCKIKLATQVMALIEFYANNVRFWDNEKRNIIFLHRFMRNQQGFHLQYALERFRSIFKPTKELEDLIIELESNVTRHKYMDYLSFSEDPLKRTFKIKFSAWHEDTSLDF